MTGASAAVVVTLYKGDDFMFEYCKLSNGELVSKAKVDAALELVAKLKGGYSIVELSDNELFTKGNKVEAIKYFMNKHNVSLAEAKEAIEFMRGEK